MDPLALLDPVRSSPGDADLRNVLADALLGAGDPRGALMRAQLDGHPPDPSVMARCVRRVREAAPGATFVRFEGGLVTELHVGPTDAARIDPVWLTVEPLVVLVTTLPAADDDDPEAAERGWTDLLPVLALCRGWCIESTIDASWWPRVRDAIEELQPLRLDLGVGVEVPEPAQEALHRWPFVRIAQLPGDPAVALRLLACMPRLRALSLGGRAGPCLDAALTLSELTHLDLRGATLDHADLEKISAWVAPGRSVRHAQLGLGPPPGEDPFGSRGLTWMHRDPPTRRVVAVPGDDMTFANARSTTLRVHVRDDPQWQRELTSPVLALAARAGEIVVGRADGVIEGWSAEAGISNPIATLPGPIRSICARGADLAATFDGGWWTSEGERGDEALSALVLTPTGRAWALGTQVRDSGGRTLDLGEPVLALTAHGDDLYAVAGAHVWHLRDRGEDWSVERIGSRGPAGRGRVVASDDVIAWITGRSSATSQRDADRSMYSGSYLKPSGAEFVVADLSTTSDGAVLVALEHGGLNILTATGALKADEHPGEDRADWIFFHNGTILITS